jgi:hypothetical protein
MTTHVIKNQKDLDKFKDGYGYVIEGNAEFQFSAEFTGRLKVTGYLWIKAGDSIEAGGSIEAGSWIEAGDWIKAGGSIEAGGWIKAGGWIEAGSSIKAGSWIEAVLGGITCGLSITCRGLLKFKLKLFAGTSPYSWNANCSKEVKCGKLEGNVVYGDVIETGLPDAPKETITIGGIEYDKDEVEAKLKDLKPAQSDSKDKQ